MNKNIIPCFLTFCSSNQSLLSFLNAKFLNILVYLTIVDYIATIGSYMYAIIIQAIVLGMILSTQMLSYLQEQ